MDMVIFIFRWIPLTCFLIVTWTETRLKCFELVDRAGWGAKPPRNITNMPVPVPYVIIHHTYLPPACNTSDTCIETMQRIQKVHQDDFGWNDIGYSFAVGGDGKVYEGRGWSAVGAHAPGYNSRSVGICLIGDWMLQLPPIHQLNTTKEFLKYGVSLGKIHSEYILYGHRQITATLCPGDMLYQEITTWKHFKNRTIGS